jgi:O-antigen/teichoic acid export membrane protein
MWGPTRTDRHGWDYAWRLAVSQPRPLHRRGTSRRELIDLIKRSPKLGPLAIATVVSTANSLAIALVYARIAGANAYGVYQLALSLTALAGLLALAGSSTATMRAGANGRSAAWPIFRARLPFCVLASLVLGLAATGVAIWGDRAVGYALAVGAVLLPWAIGGDVFQGQLLGRQRYRDYLRFQIALQGSAVIAVVVAVVAAPGSPWLAVLAYFACVGLTQMLGILRSRADAHALPDDVRYARHVSGVSILNEVDSRLDITLPGVLLGPKQAGIVAVARALSNQVRYFWGILYQPIFVRLAAGTPKEGLAFARRYRWMLVAVMGLPCGLGIALSPLIIPGFFGPQFDTAVPTAQLLLLAIAVVAMGSLEAVFLKAQGYLRQLAFTYVALPIFSLVTLPPLILTIGVIGVGVEAVAAALLYVGLAIHFASRAADRPPSPRTTLGSPEAQSNVANPLV